MSQNPRKLDMSFSRTGKRKNVILDHDGGVDDIVALIALAACPESVNLLGVVVIDADCYVDFAAELCGKVLSGMQCESSKRRALHEAYIHGYCQDGLKDGATKEVAESVKQMFNCYTDDLDAEDPFEYLGRVPIGKSTLTGVHPFPSEWRKDANNMNDFPCVNTPSILKQYNANNRHACELSGEELMAKIVMTSTEPVHICVTGPLSNVAYCVDKYGEKFTKNVESVVIMGGAVDVKGNVFKDTTDSSAEWNFYWDAPSAKTVLGCHSLRNILFALDATNFVPVTSEFVHQFAKQRGGDMVISNPPLISPCSFLSEFVGASWAMCTHLVHIYGKDAGYYAWDVLTAAYLITNFVKTDDQESEHKALVGELEEVSLDLIDTLDHTSEGRSRRIVESTNIPRTFVTRKINADVFYDMILSLCRRL
eukprot:Tbor_TRINITY_DN5471_c1_g1::TRINITY_DN5471_c1_g1_i1::g.24196::m.24196/K01239/iunH; purine nucleosidase